MVRFFDLHCDTLKVSFHQKLDDIYEIPGSMLDIRRMGEAGSLAQCFAIFMPPKWTEPVTDSEYLAHCFQVFKTAMERHRDIIAPALSGGSIERNKQAGRMSAFLSFEDGRPIDGKLENLDAYYDMGIRLITLTWNGENCFGFPNSKDPVLMQKGLKPFGKGAVRRMNELGIVLDVSHLSDGGFYDVAEISKKPFMASHSNCRALSPHQRNLTDDMIRTLAEKGGVAGLNFAPAFLNADTACRDSTAALISAHARRMIDVGGVECAALGSDFDGISGNLEISGVEKMRLLFDRFHHDGLSDDVIEKIAWKNALRVFKDITGDTPLDLGEYH